jgi:hypothetical protein
MTRGIRTVTKRLRRPSVQVMLLWLLAALFIGALAACTQATDAGIPTASESQAASSVEANSAQAETTPAAEDPEDAALVWARCMRENGVPEFPDPDSQGRILLSPPGSIDPDSAEFQGAREACLHLAPEGWGEAKVDPGDEEVMLEFASCMRENGLPDYPDPNAGLRIFGPDSKVDPNDPKVQAALESCKAILQDLQSGPQIGG